MTPQNPGSIPPDAPPPGTPGTIKDPIVTLLLIAFTCGIYGIYWLYVTSTEMQNFTGDHSISPILEIVLVFVTGGLYGIYWYYKYFSMIPKMQAQVGLPVTDNTLIWFILMFVPIAHFYSVWSFQTELNNIYTAAGQQAA
ncbi:MAG TPA: DUF4234 domain-containing protein [Capsulimonadaceae bacterium]|jgi:hypothetical protein